MKNSIFIGLLLLAVMLAPNNAEAQIKRFLKEKAVEALRGSKQEETVSESEDYENENQPAHSKPAGPSFLERKMMKAMGFNNVAHEQSYSFSSTMVMDIEYTDSLSSIDKMQYITYFEPESKNYAMIFDVVDPETGATKKSTMLFDMKNRAMLILGEENGERSGMAISIPRDSTETDDLETNQTLDEPVEDYINPMYKATGRSKNIAGYNCNEYAYQTDEGKIVVWATNERRMDISDAYGQLNGMQGLATIGLGFGNAMVMEMESEDLSSGAKTIMHIRQVESNISKTIDLSGYQIIGMGSDQ
ncbi:MAG: hypothetical protein WC951_02405 [Bacteroidales bacterium]|nr:hypothetical protein [Tenuifilaceae bacterium]